MDGNDSELLMKHATRQDIPWIPWHARISEGLLLVTDEGQFARVEMEVSGLGTLVILGERVYSASRQRYEWTTESQLSASVK